MKNLSNLLIFSMHMAFLIGSAHAGSDDPYVNYIEQYKTTAISEMERTGIPASIKLAQGLVESGAGKSTLAREANNHFGIKCNGGWTGDTHYREDDDYENGKLIKSCFRKFKSAHESYIAHSHFLTDQKRYRSLFSLARQDYRSWAKGLKKAGYATDPAYANKLINVIEKYRLYQYDDAIPEVFVLDEVTVPTDNLKAQVTELEKYSAQGKFEPIPAAEDDGKQKNKRSRSERKAHKESLPVAHRVNPDERIASIARKYNLDESVLRLRNRLPKDAEVLVGEKLYLRKKISILKRPRFTRTLEQGTLASSQDDYIF